MRLMNTIKIINLMKKLITMLMNVVIMSHKMDTQSFGFLIKKKYSS